MTLESGVLLQHERYEIMERLGEGGMGTVYLAADRNLPGRMVAIKENDVTTPNVQAQFQREAVILARLSHPNLPKVTDHFIEPSGRQYLVMDYIAGEDLQRLTLKERGFVAEAKALNWIGQICDALTYMHTWKEQNSKTLTPVLHRDIKPSNIKCTPDGHIVLVDFGLAKFHSNSGTSMGARAYTPGYAPIEQYTGGTDVRSDIYALGATLYSILTGKKPPPAPTLAAETALTPPRQFNPRISPNTESVILRAMSMAPSRRFQSAIEMKTALLTPSRYADEAVTVPPTQPPSSRSVTERGHSRQTAQTKEGQQTSRGLPLWLTMLVLLLLGGVAVLLWYLFGSQLNRVNLANSGEPEVVAVIAATDTDMNTVEEANAATETVRETDRETDTGTDASTAASEPSASEPSASEPSQTPVEQSAPPPTGATAGEAWTHERAAAVYRFVPAGEFTMGSNGTSRDEEPTHLVSMSSFWIMETEVTNRQYAVCVGQEGCTPPANQRWQDADFADYPVTDVSWDQAAAYAVWAGGRLPTEAEWEKAARSEDLRPYPWGADQPTSSHVNYRFEMTEPVAVGQYDVGASPYGVLDMAGNVEEWVQDWYAPDIYTQSAGLDGTVENPQGPETGVMRVVRGGSFNSNPLAIRTTARGKAIPSSSFESVGFRIVIASK